MYSFFEFVELTAKSVRRRSVISERSAVSGRKSFPLKYFIQESVKVMFRTCLSVGAGRPASWTGDKQFRENCTALFRTVH